MCAPVATRLFLKLLLTSTVALAATACGDECSANAVQVRLNAASRGTTVDIASCRVVRGSLSVPEGVALRGNSSMSTTILGATPDGVVIGDDSRLEFLRIAQHRGVALRKIGSASALARSVIVESTAGAAVLVEAGQLHIETSSLNGAAAARASDTAMLRVLPDERSNEIPQGTCGASSPVCVVGARRQVQCESGACQWDQVCDSCGQFSTVTATHGIIANANSQVIVSDSTIRGFALYGAMLLGASLQATRVTFDDNIGFGLFAQGGSVALEDSEIHSMRSGSRTFQSAAIATAQNATLRLARSTIRDNEGFGVAMHTGAAEASVLRVERNAADGWVGHDLSSISIDDGTFNENRGVAMQTTGATRVTITRSTFLNSSFRTTIVDNRIVRLGDGILLLNPAVGSTLTDLTLRGNARVQLLVSIADTSRIPIEFARISVDAPDNALGALLGTSNAREVAPISPATWGGGEILRSAAVAQRDLASLNPIAIPTEGIPSSVSAARERVGIVMPIM